MNGDTTSACNGAGSGSGTINLGGLDRTLSPASNTLGTVTITLGPGANQSVALYADYDVSYSSYLSFDDSASTSGARPAGTSFSVNNPNTSSLFSDFAGNPPTLDNLNWLPVGSASGPPNECCDVAFALALGNINVLAGGSATATFAVTGIAPLSGFYIQQTNSDTQASIYLQGSVNVQNPGTGGAVPEPSTLGMVLLSGGFLVAWKRFRAAR